jgi:hypothetical protein
MHVIVDCTGCGRTFKTRAEYAGKRVACPACGGVIQIPAPAPATTAAAAPPMSPVEGSASVAPPAIEPAAAVPPIALRAELVLAPPPLPPPIVAQVVPPGGPRGTFSGPHTPPLAVYGTPPAMAHQLTKAPIGQFLLWNFLSLNIFGAIYLNLLHGRMPRLRANDPSAGQAIGFLFIPFFNFYWLFFTYLRLVDRLDEQRAMRGIRPGGIRQLALQNCILTIVGAVLWFTFIPSLVHWLFVFPWFFSQVLRHMNALVEISGQAAETANMPAVIAQAEERAAREFHRAWGGVMYVLAAALALATLAILTVALGVAVTPRPPQPDAPDKLPAVLCLLFFASLVGLPAGLAYRQGRRMRRT